MNTEKSTVEKLYITGAKALDPITVYFEDIRNREGMMTIVCYGKSWTGYWGGMGDNIKVKEFIAGCHAEYIANRIDHDRATKRDTAYLIRIVEAVISAIKSATAQDIKP